MGDVILTDFGLAKSTATGSKYTRTGQALGTPAYMSPEQACGEGTRTARGESAALGPRSDVWSLGCVLYELLTGRRAFDGGTAAEVVARVLTAEPSPLRAIRTDLPASLSAVLRVCLSKAAHDRYASARELRDDLGRVLRGERVQARPGGRHARRIAAGVLALAAAAAVAILARPSATAPARPEPVPGAVSPELETKAAGAWERRGTDPAGAAATLADALAAAPGRHDWRLRLGLLHWIRGDGVRAREAWDAVPAGESEQTSAGLYLGLEAFFSLDPDRAGAPLQAVAAGRGPEARLASAALHISDEQWAEARAALATATGWEASLLRAYIESFDPAGDLAAAVRLYTEALDSGPRFAWAHYNRGACRAQLGDHAGDVADCTEALRINPAYLEARINRGVSRSHLHDEAGAVEDFTVALAAGPDHEAFLNRGESREALADPAGARADYDAAIRCDPSAAVGWFTRARLAEREGDDDAAMRDLDEAIVRGPGHAPSRILRGQIRARRREFADAIADLDAAVAALPGNADPLAQRGIVRGQAGDVPGALADLTASLRLRPDDAETLVNRGVARAMSDDDPGARTDYEAAVRVDPGFARAHASLALARVTAGDLRGGLEAAETALRLMGEGAPAGSLHALRDRLRVELGLPPAGG